MYQKIDLAKTVFIDIETVPEQTVFDLLDETWQYHWQDKWRKTRAMRYRHVFDEEIPEEPLLSPTEEAAQAYREAGLYAEFGKVCCVTVGLFKEYYKEPGGRHFQVTSFYGTDECQILDMLARGLKGKNEMIGGMNGRGGRFAWTIIGHNVKEFDVPYLCRRMLVHGMDMPDMLDVAGKKPWDIPHIVDTMELWKFGDYKSFTSLNLLAHRFDIPSPKDNMDGSGVFDAYRQGLHDDIGRYCGKDVQTVAQLLLRWRKEELLLDEEVEYVAKTLHVPTPTE